MNLEQADNLGYIATSTDPADYLYYPCPTCRHVWRMGDRLSWVLLCGVMQGALQAVEGNGRGVIVACAWYQKAG